MISVISVPALVFIFKLVLCDNRRYTASTFSFFIAINKGVLPA